VPQPRLAVRLAAVPLLLAALGGSAHAQAGRTSPQAECTAANRDKHAALMQAVDAARKRSVLNPVLVSRLQTFESQQAKLRDALRRNARSEAECDQLATQIDGETDRLAKLVGTDAAAPTAVAAAASAPGPTARVLAAPPAEPLAPSSPPPPPPAAPVDLTCLNGVAQDFNGVVQNLAQAQREARAGESELAPLANRLNDLRARTTAAMQSASPTREQCEALGRELANERDTLQRLTAGRNSPPPVALADVPAAPAREVQREAAYAPRAAPEPAPSQVAASMQMSEPVRPVDPRARACSADLRLSFRDVEQAMTSLAEGGNIAAQGKAMARRLLQTLLLQQVVIFSRDVMSLEDCQQLVQTVADLRSQAQQLRASYTEARASAQAAAPVQQAAYVAPQPQQPRTDPRLDDCRGLVRRTQAELQQQFQNQQRTGRVSSQEFGEYQNISSRLNQMMGAVFRDGASFGDCQQTAQFINQAEGAVQRMAQVDPRIESCKAQVRQGYNEAQQQLQFAARSGRMTPQKAQALQSAQARLSNLGNMAQRDFGSLGECQNVGNALAQERSNIQGLAR